MKKVNKEMDASEFLRELLKKYPDLAPCLNCPHHNGDCVDFAKQGKCKAY